LTGRRRARGAALAGLLVLAAATTAGAGMADRVGATFGLMAEEFIRAFQPLEGLIVAVEGDVVYLDLGAGSGVQAGQEFTVFRKGDVFRHPVTGAPLGRYEDILGHAQVRRVHAQFAEAALVRLPDRPAPVPADGARISRARIRIAVTPVLDLTGAQADLRRVPYLLATALERSRRFQVVDPLAVTDMFASSALRVEEMLARPERAARAARSLEVAAWLVPILLERRGVTYLDVTLISAVTGTALLSHRQAVLPASAAEEQRFPWEPRAED
jgi:hypothetical protein